MLYTTSPNKTYQPESHIDPTGFGKVALVTGCASGIGLAVTQLLLAHQFSVCGLDVEAFDYGLVREGDQGRFHFTRGDLVSDGGCEEGVRVCLSVFGGKIDVLVNVAGVMDNFSSADTITDDLWDRVLAVNLTVPVRMMRAVLPTMKARGDGVIINVASTAGVSGAVAGVAYTASKHGLIGATKNVAWRFRNDGIRCNAVLPGAVDSSIGKVIAAGGEQQRWDSESFAEIAKRPVIALQAKPSQAAPMITPLEVARAIVFLVGDQARTINGISLPVDKAWGVI
ncbi:putative short-chain dehydrogenase [Echria macrotheca]|uniref:3-oxoacyl-[acyl-carrier-protein] reductase n=1 Tax=Echria macrotheca TaxID=438768 RepID=A0AAJ0F231_9PEZI|nr:putative short-chain dehydrogenase [Echria macrotheca]